MKILSKIIFVILFGIVNINAQNKSVVLKQLWTIGNDDKAPVEYLFRFPKIAKLDRNGNLYLLENHDSNIKVYSKDGKYIKTIGRQGKGPGEFVAIGNFCITKKDELIILDIPQQRISIYDNKKGFLKTKNFPPLFEPIYFDQIGGSSFICSNLQSIIRKNMLFEIYDPEFKTKIDSYLDIKYLIDTNDKFQNMQKTKWKISMIDSTKLIATPVWYSGVIYLFQKNKNEWKTISMKGVKPARRSYSEYSESEFNDKKSGNMSVMSSGKNRIFYEMYNRSIGIMTLNNKYILSFIVLNNKDGAYDFGVDLFTLSGEYLGYTKIKTSKDVKTLYADYLATDKNSTVYFTEYDHDIPVIRKYMIKID